MIIYEEVLKEFQKQKVKYVIVGGIAVNLLGSLRSTADMDILVEMSDSNSLFVQCFHYPFLNRIQFWGIIFKESSWLFIQKHPNKIRLPQAEIKLYC